jgi:hypothetical protein
MHPLPGWHIPVQRGSHRVRLVQAWSVLPSRGLLPPPMPLGLVLSLDQPERRCRMPRVHGGVVLPDRLRRPYPVQPRDVRARSVCDW